MISGIVSNTMKDAIVRFAEKEGVECTDVTFFIHTKSEDRSPSYFYAIKGTPKKDEDGKVIKLTFNNILGVKFDVTGRGIMAGQFLRTYFKTLEEAEEKDAKTLYLSIGSKDEEVKELKLGLYQNGSLLKPLTLAEVFGEE